MCCLIFIKQIDLDHLNAWTETMREMFKPIKSMANYVSMDVTKLFDERNDKLKTLLRNTKRLLIKDVEDQVLF